MPKKKTAPKKPAKKAKLTPQNAEIVCVLDRSGSMHGMWNEALGGFNSFLETQQKLPGKAKLTLCMFDDQYDLLYDGEDIQKAKPLTNEIVWPRGMTALMDAIGRTVNHVQARITKTPKNRRADKVILTILTDGHENASKEFSREKVKEMLLKQTKDSKWEIIYLAANQDAFDATSQIGLAGVKGVAAINFAGDAKGTTRGYTAMNFYASMGRMTPNCSYRNDGSLSAEDIANDASLDPSKYIQPDDDKGSTASKASKK